MERVLRRVLPAAILVGLAVPSAGEALVAAVPERAVLEGEFRIDRATPDDCFVSVPPLLAGTIRLTVDYQAGTVAGSLEGRGSGEDRVPGGCRSSGSAAVYRADVRFSGEIEGTADPTTGRFQAAATLEVEGEGFYSVPGSQLSCALSADPGLQDECPLASVASPQTAEVMGTLTSDEPFGGAIDWYTDFCLAVSGSGVSYTREGCPTRGTWTAQALEIILPANRDPVISDVAVGPEAPREGEPVVLTAVAHDPDGDELTFHWTVDGVAQGATGASLRLTGASAGDYWVELAVVDERGGRAETSLGFTVAAVAPPATEAVETTTTSLLFGDDPLAAADQDEVVADEEAAAPGDPSTLWQPGSGGALSGSAWLRLMLILATVFGVTSASILIGFIVRVRMGWSSQEAGEDAVRAEGLRPSTDEDDTLIDVLREASDQLEGPRPPAEAPPSLPGSAPPPPPPGSGAWPPPAPVEARPAFTLPGDPSPGTPSSYHQRRPGLKPGSYRWVHFAEPVYLEKPIAGGGIELITTQYTEGLVGEPDPGFPGHSPAYDQQGNRIGWVRTADLPK